MDVMHPVDPFLAPALDQRPALSAFKGFGLRAAAWVIDTLISYALLFAAAAGVGLAGAAFAPLFGVTLVFPGLRTSFREFALSLALSVLYFALFETISGATPGKALLRMRVVMVDGRAAPWWAALGRGLARLVPDGIFAAIPAALSMNNSPMRQRLGDKWVGTVVVDSRDPGIATRRGVGSLLLAALAGILPAALLVGLMTGATLAPSLPPVSAEQANVTQADVTGIAGAGYALIEELDTAQLAVPDASSASARTFQWQNGGIMTLVAVFPRPLGDNEAAMRSALSQYIDAQVAGSGLSAVKSGGRVVPLGDLCVSEDFTLRGAQTRGTAVLCRWQNRMVRVLAYDTTGADVSMAALSLAQKVADKMGAGEAAR